MSDIQSQMNSKKVFFIYPVPIILDLLKELLKNGYEVYVLNDHEKLKKIVKKYPYSIVYINIYEKMDEKKWEPYIKALINDPENIGIQVGICTYTNVESQELAAKYLMELGVTGGFVNVFSSFKKSFENIRKVLEASEAKGKRKHVRVKPFHNDNNTFALIYDEKKNQIKAKICDISIACMNIELENAKFVKNQVIKSIVLKLRGIPCQVDAVVVGFHAEDKNKWLLIFVIDKHTVSDKIYDYIYERLQTEIQD